MLQKAGTATQSFTADLLSAEDYNEQKAFALKTCAATIFAGGADTVRDFGFDTVVVFSFKFLPDRGLDTRLDSNDDAFAGQDEEGTTGAG